MNVKKRQKQNSLLLVLVLLFNIVTQAIVPIAAYAETAEDPENSEDSAVEEVTEINTLLELLSIAEVRTQEVGEVRTKGIVTAKLNNNIYIQDETAAIAIKQTDLDVVLGDEITVNGQLISEEDLLMLDGVVVEENSGNVDLPEPLLLTGVDLVNHPSELVILENIEILDVNEEKLENSYTAIDSEGTEFLVLDENNNLDLAMEETYSSIIGIVSILNDENVLIPRDSEDIVVKQVTEETPFSAEEDPVLDEEEAQALVEDPIDVFQDEAAGSFDLSLMHMNDTHARVENYPKLITAIKDFRNDHENSLLFHAGDVFSGTLYFNEFRGQADLALMNMMGIDAMVFGNHEFDLGDSADGHKALAEFVEKANFPLLGTNIDFSGDSLLGPLETNQSSVEGAQGGAIYDSIILDVEGEKIGVFGLTTEDTEYIASPMAVKFNNYITAAGQAVTEFEEKNIDKIIAVTHIGYDSSPKVGNDLLLAEHVEGIDIIVGGHSHTKVTPPKLVNEETENPTVIVQAGQYGENLGTLNVTFDEEGKITDHSGELREIKEVAADAEALKKLEKYKTQVEEINNEEIGAVAKKDLLNPRQSADSNDSVRANETELGNLVTDAMLAKAREKYPETVIAFQNGGGIREKIDKGPITVGEVISVLPFGNDPVIAELTGQEIKDILEHSVHNAPAEHGGFLHVSGMEFYYDSTREPCNRIVAMYVKEGKNLIKINPETIYTVTTNGFTGQGGDGFETFAQASAEGRVKDIGEIDWQQLVNYMVEEQYLDGVVDPVIEGRIVDLFGQDLVDYQINQLKNRIAELEEAIRQLEAQNESLADEVAALREILAELRAALEGNIEDLTALEERIAELEARIAELEKEQDSNDTEDPEETEDPESSGNSGSSGGTGNAGKPGGGGTSEETTNSEKKPVGVLPKTGVNLILPFASGATLLVVGLGTEVYRRKRK